MPRASGRGMAAAAIAVAWGLAGCGMPEATSEEAIMDLTSAAFDDGEAIPARYTCDAEDVSPPLRWSGAPDATAGYALIVDDPDARGFVHWVLADIPGDAAELPEGEGDSIGTPGPNDFGRTGWAGPCPPRGEHRYVFTLYALSEPLGLGSGTSADAVRRALEGRVLGEAVLTARYSRGG